MFYYLDSDKVMIGTQPHDCAFLAAPIGEKYCHYERVVSFVRWATSTQGPPIVSYDDDQTWKEFTPDANAKLPGISTVVEVQISWVKKDE